MKSASLENLIWKATLTDAPSARQHQHHDQQVWSSARIIWSEFDRRPRVISIAFEAFVTDFYAFSTLFGVLDNFLTNSDGKVSKSFKSLSAKTRFRLISMCFCMFLNLWSDLDRRAFSNTASAPRPARLKQLPHHLKRFWQAPTSDLSRFWPISIVFDSFLFVFERFLEKSPKGPLNLCLKRLGNGLVSFEQILVDLLHSYERKSTKTSEVEDRPDRRPRMISMDLEAFVTDFYAFSMLFNVLDSFLTDSDRKVLKSRKSLCEKIRFQTNSMCFCVLLWQISMRFRCFCVFSTAF